MKNLTSKIHLKKKRPIKVMQYGEGNFLRAFVDWIIQTMNETNNFDSNIVVVQPLCEGRISNLKEQDGLYTVFLEGLENGEVKKESKIIDCLDDFINPYKEYEKYLSYAKSNDLQFIISNTTEAGIVFDASDTDYTKTPKSFPGKLLAFLKKRYDYFNGKKDKGLYIIPCELIDYNGNELKNTMVQLSNLLNYDDKFLNWLINDNYYFNTLVDRIVPGYPKDRINELESELGYHDNSLVLGEIFHLWVIEDKKGKLSRVFPIENKNLNIKLVDDFVPYKERKVKILNGSHTLMAPIGILAGLDNVRDTVNDDIIGKFIKEFIFEEIIPTIKLPYNDMVSFALNVLERYQNPYIDHQLLSITLNSFTKYKTRILPSVLENISLNVFPKKGLFALASLIVFYRGEKDNENYPLFDNQEFLDLMANLWSKFDDSFDSIINMVTTVLGLEHWAQDLNNLDNVTAFVSKCVFNILNNDIKIVIKGL